MYKPNYFQRRTKFQGPRTNHKIKSIDVQVINSNGENLGILPLKKAIDTAKQEGLDLIEISPNANPPVCKIMDMGKYKYDMQKKANKAKKNQKYFSNFFVILDMVSLPFNNTFDASCKSELEYPSVNRG